MANVTLRAGMLVRHPTRAAWGLGKVLEARGNTVKVRFKDDGEKDYRTFSMDRVQLLVAADESDPQLDNLPPFLGDRFDVTAKRVSHEAGVRRFLEIFPLGFRDPEYLGTGRPGKEEYGERDYKVGAHEHYLERLGGGQGEGLLDGGEIGELIRRASTVVSKDLNLLSPFETMAFRDGLDQSHAGAERFFRAMFEFVAAGAPRAGLFECLAGALLELPVAPGKARVATWPVLTILPFLARPDCFMFLKPEPTKECAERRRFHLQYSSGLAFITYHKLMTMSQDLLDDLRQYGARDFIDVQSFIWVVARY